MKPIEFLSPSQIQDLQIQEAQSDRDQYPGLGFGWFWEDFRHGPTDP